MNKKILLLSVLLVIACGLVAYAVLSTKQSALGWPVGNRQINNKPTNQAGIQPDNNQKLGWRSYRNDQLGIAFDYPKEWGDVIIEEGNGKSVLLPPCEEPVMGTTAKYYAWGLYTSSLSFSQSPVDIYIRLLDLASTSLPQNVCNDGGEEVAVYDIQPLIEGQTKIMNRMGIQFSYDGSLASEINTDLVGPLYAARYADKLVWIESGFAPVDGTPEADELENDYIAPCNLSAREATSECGIIAWESTGKTAAPLRQGLADLQGLVDSFSFSR